jgi:hypothetical protein
MDMNHDNDLGGGDPEQDLMNFLAAKGMDPDDIHQACQIRFGGGAQDDEIDGNPMERPKAGIDDDEPTGPPGEVAQAAGQRLAPGGGNVGFGQSDQGAPLSNGLQRLVQLVNALEEPEPQDDQMPMPTPGAGTSTPLPTSAGSPMTTPSSGAMPHHDAWTQSGRMRQQGVEFNDLTGVTRPAKSHVPKQASPKPTNHDGQGQDSALRGIDTEAFYRRFPRAPGRAC